MFNNKFKLSAFLFIVVSALIGCVGEDNSSSEKVSGVAVSKASSEGASNTEDGEENTDVVNGATNTVKGAPEGYGKVSSPWNIKTTKDLIHGSKNIYQNVSSSMIDINNVFTEMILLVTEKPGSVINGKRDYDVSIRVESGRFFCPKSSLCTIKVKVGDVDKVYEYSINNPKDFDLIIIKNRTDFIDTILKAKKLLIEAEFYGDGRRQFEFDVSGFPGETKATNDLEIFAPSRDSDKLW